MRLPMKPLAPKMMIFIVKVAIIMFVILNGVKNLEYIKWVLPRFLASLRMTMGV